MSIQWNDAQIHAIEGRDGTMLVSAAAGSGKTAVLVERVIRRLTEGENPCGIEDLLIVTFTNAAANQMKEKIVSALQDKIAVDPGNKNLRKAVFMLPYANISTIDSFCNTLVRDNYHALGISPDFQILDNSKKDMLEQKAVMDVINRFHEEREDEFRRLNTMLNSTKNDKNIIETVKKLYDISRAHTFPGEYLENLLRTYTEAKPVDKTEEGRAALETAREYCRDVLALIDRCIDIAASDPTCEPLLIIFEDDKRNFEELKDTVYTLDWDTIHEAFMSLKLKSFSSSQKPDPVTKELLRSLRNYSTKDASNSVFKKLDLFRFSEEDYENSVRIIAPAVKTLIDTVTAYGETLRAYKDEINAYAFDDIMHFALSLLVRSENGEAVKTDLARQLSENYEEILVDEYQDVNKAQNSIFAALSKDNTNRFMVGDVKQSIYGFRKAMPEIFTSLRKEMCDYDGVNYPARVDLSANYRSRKGITDTVNFIFSQLMTEQTGGVDYDDREKLVPDAKYPESSDPCTEVYLFETEDKKAQAVFAANYIRNAVENKMQIYTGKELRDASYGDFCILARDNKSAKIFSEVFRNAHIPLIVDASSNLLEAPEVSFIVSLLKVIDNPLLDVPLTAVMLSPVYGFTTDEISEMRINQKKGSIYRCLCRSAESGNEKAAHFIKELEKLRRIAVNLPASEFTERIIEETGYRAIVSAMDNSENRLAFVEKFLGVAQSYESSGVKGISAFVRFLDSAGQNSTSIDVGSNLTDISDAVTMCTIHKSKGLEYPVVFLCKCEKGYNNRSTSDPLLVSDRCGIGLKYSDDGVTCDNFLRECVKKEIRLKERSEELRVLYVALTRAKEKLIIMASDKNWQSKLEDYAKNVAPGINPSPAAVAEMNSYAQVILTALLKHPDAHVMRNLINMSPSVRENCESEIIFEIIKDTPEEEGTQEAPEEVYEADPALLARVSEKLAYTYPYDELGSVIAKRIASDFEDEGFDLTYFASEVPGFVSKGGLTPAQKGTATHRFMQYADYRKAAKDPESELERLVAESLLTPEEAAAVDRDSIRKFFTSTIADRIFALPEDKVFKEYAFTVSLPLSEVYPDIPADKAQGEVIIIEGVADLAFIEDGKLVIVDYKTDRANSLAQLAVRYAPQLTTYRKCLSQAFGMEVKETLIYSFRLGAQIEIK